MSRRYLLPCSCGQAIRVEASQAGQEIRCPCGAVLEVPPIRSLAQLERADKEPPAGRPSAVRGETPSEAEPAARKRVASRPGSTWGARQRLLFVGAIVTAIGLGLLAYLYLRRPRLPEMESLTPIGTWRMWHDLRHGIEYRPEWVELYLESVAASQRWMIVAGAIATVGALLLASSLLVSTRRPRRRTRRPPPKGRPPRRKAG